MSAQAGSTVVVGGGIFGVSAAVELRRRGHDVTLVDPGPVPHVDASSTDTSKAVRMDYGSDAFLMDFAAATIDGWRRWNRDWDRELFHETGILILTPGRMAPGSFEAESLKLLVERGVPAVPLDAAALGDRFPAWRGSPFAAGYFNPVAGWAESAGVVERLAAEASATGVRFVEGRRCARLLERGSRVVGVCLDSGQEIHGDRTLVAAGAWTPTLLPHLSGFLWATGQPVVWLRPADRESFEGRRFPVWCADIARSGRYGFPVTADGLLKVGHHGDGRRVEPGTGEQVTDEERDAAARYVSQTFPRLGPVDIVRSRLCFYCDTWDSDFLIDHDPDRPGLVVACGGSGHGFKFAPLLGQLIADVIDGRSNRRARRFAWRTPGERRTEHARLGGTPGDVA